jgi:hypothetical protein
VNPSDYWKPVVDLGPGRRAIYECALSDGRVAVVTAVHDHHFAWFLHRAETDVLADGAATTLDAAKAAVLARAARDAPN